MLAHRRPLAFALVLALALAATTPAIAGAEETNAPPSLRYLSIAKVSSYLDGGTTVIKGDLHGEAVQVRHDLMIGSPTRGTIFLQRGNAPEVVLPSDALEDLGDAITRDLGARKGLAGVARALSERSIAEGITKARGPDRFLRSFRVTDVSTWGHPRGQFHIKGTTKNGLRSLLVFGDKLLLKSPSYGSFEERPRPLVASERTALLRALSAPAIARLPNARLRSKAVSLRAAVAREHAADRPARTGR